MAVKVGKAYVEIEGDFSKLDDSIKRATDGTRSKFKAIGATMARGLAAGAAVSAAAFVALGKAGIDAASDIDESLSKNEKLFGASAKTVEKFAQTSAKSYGVSRRSVLEYTGVFGNLFRALGQSEKASASQSVALTKLAADMASFNNTSVEEALDAIRSGLVGETEPLRKFGVNMNDATLKAQALKMGLISTTKDALSPQNKALAASALITKQTAQAHGDFERTSGGLANQQKILRARLDDAQAALGQRLLPIALKVTGALNDLMDRSRNLGSTLQSMRSRFAGTGEQSEAFRAAMVNLRGALDAGRDAILGVVDVATVLWKQFGDEFVAALKNNARTIAATLEGIAKAVRGLVDLVAGVLTGDWRRAWDGLRGIVTGTLDAIKSYVSGAFNQIKILTGAAWGAVRDLILGALRGARDGIVDVLTGIGNRVSGAWSSVRTATGSAWEYVRDKILGTVRAARDTIGDVLTGIGNRVSGAWATVRAATTTAWDAVRDKVLGALRGARDLLPEIMTGVANRVEKGFETIVGAAGSFASTVKDKISDGFKSGANLAIRFINGIISAINKIPGVPDIKEVPQFRMGGTTDGLARGGTVHHDQFARGGEITRPMVVVGEEAPRHPEYVIPTNPAYRSRALGLHAQLSRQLGVPGFALGGILSAPAGLLKGGADWVLDKLPSPSSLPGWLEGTGKYVIGQVTKWIKKKVSSVFGDGDAGITNIATGLLKRLNVAGVTDRIREAIAFSRAFGNWTFGPGQLYRPGGTTYHGVGRAVDFGDAGKTPAQMRALYRGLKARYGSSIRELFYDPMGEHVKNGQTIGAPFGGHGDHVHLALAKGGILGGPFVGSYRTGGIVPQDGFAYVHKGETITPQAAAPTIYADVFIGGEKIDERVDVRIRERERVGAGGYLAGVRA